MNLYAIREIGNDEDEFVNVEFDVCDYGTYTFDTCLEAELGLQAFLKHSWHEEYEVVEVEVKALQDKPKETTSEQYKERLYRLVAELDGIIHELWLPDTMSDAHEPLFDLDEFRDNLVELERDMTFEIIKKELKMED